jgi:secreted Zn-dependent insulinase-like peptidase
LANRFADLFDCWRASPLPADTAVVQRELKRVYAELDGTRNSPSKPLIELGVYKSHANPASRWARLGRGSAATLPLSQLKEITEAVNELRTRNYAPLGATIALTSPLPLQLAASILSEAFRNRGGVFRPAPGYNQRGPPPFGSGHAAPPLAVDRNSRFPCLTIGWCISVDDRVAAARNKPCAILGEALAAPHAGSAVEVLRGAGLAPLAVEVEPVLTTRLVASAEGWAIWQMSLTMQPGTERRW